MSVVRQIEGRWYATNGCANYGPFASQADAIFWASRFFSPQIGQTAAQLWHEPATSIPAPNIPRPRTSEGK
jgi:hypothetical protein